MFEDRPNLTLRLSGHTYERATSHSVGRKTRPVRDLPTVTSAILDVGPHLPLRLPGRAFERGTAGWKTRPVDDLSTFTSVILDVGPHSPLRLPSRTFERASVQKLTSDHSTYTAVYFECHRSRLRLFTHTPRWGDAVTCWERGVCDLSQRTYGNPRRGPKPAARRARVSECLEPGPMANPRPLSQHYPQLQSTIKGARIGWIGWSLSFSWLSLLANIWIISHGNAELHSALTAREARSSGS